MGRSVLFSLLLVLLLALPALAVAPPDLERALADYRAGRFEAAREGLLAYLASPEPQRLPEAWLTLGRIALERGEPQEAAMFCRLIPAGKRSAAVALIEGTALVAAGDAAGGIALLQALPESELELADRERRLLALATGMEQTGRPLEALVLYQQAAELPGPDQAPARAHALLAEQLGDAALAEAAFMLRGTGIGLDVLLQQAQRAAQRGDAAAARALLDEVLTSRFPFPYRAEALLLLDRLSGKAWLKRSVGVVLPLSGRYASFGNQVRRGIELAAAEHNAVRPAVEFIIRDGGTEPDENARAVTHLANEDRVMAIIGPLTGNASPAAAARAEAERIPLLALSQKSGLPETGPYTFRNALTSRQQARALVRHAVGSQGLRRFAVLAPDNRLGAELAEAFTQEVEAAGGRVVARQTYAEESTDFRRQIKLLKGEDPSERDSEEGERALGSLRQPRRKGPPPPFQALFLPDAAPRIALLAPQLVFYGIEDVQLLGSNGWNVAESLLAAGRYIDGAVFTDGFHAASAAPAVQRFVARYRERYREEPTLLEAQGYDAAGILLALLDRPEIRTREDLRQALDRFVGYPGVLGETSFNPQSGEAEKKLYLLQVQDGAIRELVAP